MVGGDGDHQLLRLAIGTQCHAGMNPPRRRIGKLHRLIGTERHLANGGWHDLKRANRWINGHHGNASVVAGEHLYINSKVTIALMDIYHVWRGDHATRECKVNANRTGESSLGCKLNGG